MKKILFYVGMAIAVASCSNNGNDLKDTETEHGTKSISVAARSLDLTDAETAMVSGSQEFAWKFFTEGCRLIDKDNIAMSPLSASMALSMLANGAAGDTRSEITDAIGIGEFDLDALNNLNAKLAYNLPRIDPTVNLSMANSFWSIPELVIKESFTESLSGYYDVDLCPINLATLKDDLNAWIKEKTEGLISEFFKYNPGFDAALVNAMYFNGPWNDSYKFSESATQDGSFLCADGNEATASFMCKEHSIPYYEAGMMQAAYLPMGDKMQYGFNVILPKEGHSIDDCIDEIMANGMPSYSERDIYLQLPKFEVEFNSIVNDVLQALGMRTMYGDNADFSNISEMPLYLDTVTQGVTFKIDEEGAEASAATVIGMVGSLGKVAEPLDFRCDRPFLYYVTEASTGAILFIGRIDTL